MPVLASSTYLAPWYLHNGHVQTLYPFFFRRAPTLSGFRTRLATPDDDFIDVDEYTAHTAGRCSRVVVLSHGLEGNSRRRYMLGMAQRCLAHGWDVLARNFRGCSGETNRQKRLYHSGETSDLHCVIEYALALGYTRIALVGFSMGGNQTLKYLGENPLRVPPEVCGAAAFSVPCHLPSANDVLNLPSRRVYMWYFMRTLRAKMRIKHQKFRDFPSLEGLESMHTFARFDERFTAPLFGFASAQDYWERASSLSFLPHVRVPTLLVNATDDPFLSPHCYPFDAARMNHHLTLECPRWGGHMGFALPWHSHSWTETRAVDFLDGISR